MRTISQKGKQETVKNNNKAGESSLPHFGKGFFSVCGNEGKEADH